jgi:hypothetical protein
MINNDNKLLGDLQTNARVAANLLLEANEARIGQLSGNSTYAGILQISVQGLANASETWELAETNQRIIALLNSCSFTWWR